MNKLKYILCLMLMTLCFTTAMAEEADGKVDVNGTVLGHIKDSYEWHIASYEVSCSVKL